MFAQAVRWKKYWAAQIRPHVHGAVLEVGAGLGVNTAFLRTEHVSSWTCIEPDAELVNQIRERFAVDSQLADCRVQIGTVTELGGSQTFDTILYIDVLEHIEKDREELEHASNLLRARGSIVVLAPAHQWLFTPFDRAVGHIRRYNKSSLLACSPKNCTIVRLAYLDCAGLLASLANRVLLQQADPGLRQILLWDRVLVPCSRLLDPLTLHSIGKSILAVWTKL